MDSNPNANGYHCANGHPDLYANGNRNAHADQRANAHGYPDADAGSANGHGYTGATDGDSNSSAAYGNACATHSHADGDSNTECHSGPYGHQRPV